MITLRYLILILFLFVSIDTFAQKGTQPDTSNLIPSSTGTDSNSTKTGFWRFKGERHSPGKAALFSAIIPGLGQAYNRRYWKIPIVYGGLATTVFFAVKNGKDWRRFSNAYRLRIDGDSTTIDEFEDDNFSDSYLQSQKNFFKRNMDLTIILSAVVYALHIIDAAVDAHLFEYDISDDLTMRVDPIFNLSANRERRFMGLRINLRL